MSGAGAGAGAAQVQPRRDVVLLGSTGSIGTQAIDVMRGRPEQFRVVALAAGGRRPELVARQAHELGVERVAVADPACMPVVRAALTAAYGALSPPDVTGGGDAVDELARTPCDVVLNGITGSIGLGPTLAALEAGRIVALANKESLVAGGPLVLPHLNRVVPVDSEHSALAQCLRGGQRGEVRRLLLTASGGPFRRRRRDDLVGVTPEQALNHPTWSMGPVVTVNSATLVNKGLELIEAHLLFGVPYDALDVVVHPQSLVHSMVEFVDGSTLAQLSPPDMRLPIALALGWPDRVSEAQPAMDWSRAQSLTFEPLDSAAFPAVALAKQAGRQGGGAPAAFNAANEEAVAAFLAGRLPFLGIVDVVSATVQRAGERELRTVADVLKVESEARSLAREQIEVT